MSDVIIKTFVEPPLDNNNYVVIDQQTGQAVLIDCSAPDERIMAYVQEQGATLAAIWLTHAHPDHVLGVTWFQKKYKVPVLLSAADASLLADMNEWTAWLNWPTAEVPVADELIDEKTPLRLGNIPVQVIATPGHTAGGMCYLIQGNLFSGDTLFRGTYGRTDLPGSDAQAMRRSLRQLMTLPAETQVFPGHGKPTTIREEKSLCES